VLAIVLGLSSALAWGLADFLGGLQSRRHPVLAVLAVSLCAGTLGLMGLALALGAELPDGRALAWAAAATLGGNVALLALYAGLAAGTMSVVAPVSASGAALPVIVGLAMGERPSGLQLAGLVLAMAGVVAVSREPAHADAPKAAAGRRALLLALVAAVGFGWFYIAMERATRTGDPVAVAAAGRLAALVVILAVVAVLRPRMPRPGQLPALAVVGVLDAGANVLYALATREGLLSVVSVLGALYPAATVVLAHVILKERISGSQRMGVGAVFGGVALIAAG
jgi:drug/metabolite transporter (DMT)-like permease